MENELEAERVYVLMKKDYRISRNTRAEWFFKKINTVLEFKKRTALGECEDELEVVSVVPRNPPSEWKEEKSSTCKYKITSSTLISFLTWKYHLVFCLDLSPSVAVVDVQDGEVMFDQVIMALGKCLEGVTQAFYVPGCTHLFQPQLYVTVVVHVPSKAVTNRVLAQDWLVTHDGLATFLEHIQHQLLEIEDLLAEIAGSSHEKKVYCTKENFPTPNWDQEIQHANLTSLRLIPDMNFVSLVQYGILSLQLIPENTTAGIVVVTNGIIGMPDISATQTLLNQLRSSAVSCSFLQVGTSYHPNCCFGCVPYLDLMHFLATATQGTYFAKIPQCDPGDRQMNCYHEAFYVCGFQSGVVHAANRDYSIGSPSSSEWSSRNKYFYTRRENSICRKRHQNGKIQTTLSALLSCRLREGYVVKEVTFKDNNHLQISLVLLWKHNVNLEYVISSVWPPYSSGSTIWNFDVVIEGSYDFLHDLYSPKKFRNLDSRTLVAKQFRVFLHGLSQTDKLLIRLHSFANNPCNYTIPESVKKRMPLFTGSPNSGCPIPYANDCSHPGFTMFWKPICMLDTSVWQKWMHIHRINLILEHEHPLPKHLHLPAPNGRYQNIQSRQSMEALKSLLTEWSSFVLLESHSYIKFLYSDDVDRPPVNFYIIRVSAKPPCVVIRVAFLGGTNGDVRNRVLAKLREKILSLTFPQRPVVKDTLVRKGLVSYVVDRANDQPSSQKQRPSAHVNCCVLFSKPLDKILIRYEKVPTDFYSFNWSALSVTSTYVPPSSPTSFPKPVGLNTSGALAHYLYRRRWIWSVQGANAACVSLPAVGRILNALLKIRLNEGFTIAYSHYGTINLVLEVKMTKSENDSSSADQESHSCVVQYILFPHHVTSSTKENLLSDDEVDVENEATESKGELQVISECWIEPQDGTVKNHKGLQGLSYKNIVQSLFPRDHECVSTIVTFEHLSLLCQKRESLSSCSFLASPTNQHARPFDRSIQYVPFSFDVVRLLSKCHQTELRFSTYVQNLQRDSGSDGPNQLLVELVIDHLARINDREVQLTWQDNLLFPFQVGERNRHAASRCQLPADDASSVRVRKTPVSESAATGCPKWRCFVKALSSTHLLVTLLPASFADVKIFASVTEAPASNSGLSKAKRSPDESVADDGNGKLQQFAATSFDAEKNGSTDRADESSCADRGSIVLPVYVYDCSLSVLINQLVNADHDDRCRDRCVDLTYKSKTGEAAEDTATLRSDTRSSEESKHASPEPRSEESYGNNNNNNNNVQLQQHCNNVESVFSKCFVLGLFRSLHLNHQIDALDVQSVVDGICTESLMEIDITNFLQTVCGHVRGFKVKTALERLRWTGQRSNVATDAGTRHDGSDIPTVKIGDDHVMLDPKFPVASLENCTCESMHELHRLIKHKFSNVLRKSFLPIPSNLDYFFYCLPSFQQPRSKSELIPDKDGSGSTCSLEVLDANVCKSEFQFERSLPGFSFLRRGSLSGRDTTNDQESGVVTEAVSQTSVVSNVDSESVASIVGDVEAANEDEDDILPPLFIHLMCTVKMKTSVGSCSVRCIPTCLGEILDCLESPITELDLSDLRITLDIICLTLHSDHESFDKGTRTTSFCSVSPLPLETVQHGFGGYQSSPEDSYPSETSGDQLSNLPEFQHQAITNFMEEIKWMLRDEIASAMLDFYPLTEKTLDMVASHVQSSPGRPGCVVEEVPLQFVFGSEQSLDKFILEFKQMSLAGYHISQEGEFYFLSTNRNASDKRSLQRQQQQQQQHPYLTTIANKFVVVQTTPHADDGTELRLLGKPTLLFDSSDDSRHPTELERFDGKSVELERNARRWKPSDDCGRYDNNDSLEPLERASSSSSRFEQELNDAFTCDAKRSGFESGDVGRVLYANNASDADLTTTIKSKINLHDVGSIEKSELDRLNEECPQKPLGPFHHQRHASGQCSSTPGLSSDVSSLVGSGQCSNTEDGYDGDSSDVDNEGDWLSDLDTQHRRLPKFWLILKVSTDKVHVYFHARDTEDNDVELQDWKDLYTRVIKNIKNICKIVNQTLLLQDLHDSRMCNQLLEPEASEDIWKFDDHLYTRNAINYEITSENNPDYHDNYLKANLDFMPGTFACNVVWQTHFILHSRLKTGPGRAGVSRGIQAMRGVLNSFSVNNRENMFVYAETSGAVFYLRLQESQCLVANTGAQSFGTDSAPGSRSSSISFKRTAEGDEDVPEARSRINSLTETASVSRISLGRHRMEDSIKLLVHGIAEAGPQIKEELVQVLQNRLDEAVLDVIAVTLSRNPKCKLTSEDVQFIQKPNEPPKAVLLFTVCAQAQPYLQAVNVYLKQNLQFLNAPNYIDNKPENHFQDYNPKCSHNQPLKEGDAFLYNRSPGSGNKGIALLTLSIVDGHEGNPVQFLSCPRPVDHHQDHHHLLEELPMKRDFESLTSTSLYVPSKHAGKYPGPWSLIQLRIWERGKLDLEQLTGKLSCAVRHALWDVVTEYRLITAPLSESQLNEGPTYCSEPATPIKDKKSCHAQDALAKKDRAPSPLSLVQVKFRELSSSVPDLMVKSRSPVASPKELPACAFKLAVSSGGLAQKEPTLVSDVRLLRRQERIEAVGKEKLHPVYVETMQDWMEFAFNLGVPSVWKHTLRFTSRYSVGFVLNELNSMVSNLSPDTTLKTFRETIVEGQRIFLPYTISQSVLKPRDRRPDNSQEERKKFTNCRPGKTNGFILIGRDFKQWRANVNYLFDEPLSEIPSVLNSYSHRSDLKYAPVVVVTNGDQAERSESASCPATALPSGSGSGSNPGSSIPGTLSLSNLSAPGTYPTDGGGSPVYVPRQKLLFIVVNDKTMEIYGYNWSVELSSKLQKQTTRLCQWNNARTSLLTGVVSQKLGLFHETASKKRKNKTDKETMKATDTDLFKLTSPPNRDTPPSFPSRRHSASQSSILVADVLRDAQPSRPVHRTPYNHIRDPVLRHGHQIQDMRNAERKEQQKKLSNLLQTSPTHTNAAFKEESLQLLKQSSRIEHYCLTPLLFLPQWRHKVAGARNPTVISLSQTAVESSLRSRHESECTVKSLDRRGSAALAVFNHGSSIFIPSRASNDDIWHTPLCATYIHEFTQYLQNLGFVPLQTRTIGKDRETLEETHVPIGLNLKNSTCHLQKSVVLGGSLIMAELSIIEPYFSVRMFCLEGSRIHIHSEKAKNAQFTSAFVDECDKLKALIHLHSFTYDYHLRSIHSYISGRQLIFRQGYHLTSFLDDFVRYYQKSPNFAWNLISQDTLTVKNITTPANLLFDHLLNHDKLYGMKVLRMVPYVFENDVDVENEYVLVQLTNRKVSYRDGNETRRTDDFDISLLISQDKSLQTDQFTLVLKYNIILTSRRELYPRAIMDKKLGKFRTVAMATPIPSRKVSAASSGRPESERTGTPNSQLLKVSSTELEKQLEDLETNSVDLEDVTNDGYQDDDNSTQSSVKQRASDDFLDDDVVVVAISDSESVTASRGMSSSQTVVGRSHSSIRQESVNYLGYFSTNEELMNQIMQEQIEEAKKHVMGILDTATIHCRRDSLWKRLLIGVRENLEDGRQRRKDDPRDLLTLGLNFFEFTELLTLVDLQPLNAIDPQLCQLLNMHVTWYQGLVKVLVGKYPETHRLFTEPDGSSQFVVVVNQNYSRDMCMMLSVEPQSNRASLNVVYRIAAPNFEHTPEKPNFHVQAVQSLIQDFVNACCFHLWTCIV